MSFLVNPYLPFPAAGGGDGADLLTNLVAYWDMDEASGTRVDSHSNSHDLTDNNTVTSNTGVFSNGAQFDDANDEFLSRANASMGDLDIGTNDLAVSLWFNLDVFPQVVSETSLCNTAGDNISRQGWAVSLRGTTSANRINVRLADSAATIFDSIDLNSAATFSTATWYHLVVNFDRSGNATAYVDGVLQTDTVDISSLVASDIASTKDFVFGRRHSGSNNWELDGGVDEAGVWTRLLTSDEITWLYNSGTGRQYSEFG